MEKILSVDSNKMEIANFFAEEWARDEYAPHLLNRALFVTHCTHLTSTDGQKVSSTCIPALECTHKEADMRLFLHSVHACQSGSRAVVIRSPVTDAAILTITHCPQIRGPIYFKTGTKHRTQFIDIRAVRTAIGEEVSKSLSGLHALTGYDSVSAFKRRGKKSALNLVMAKPAIGNGLQHLGEDFVVTPNVHDVCEAFVCQLYNSRELNDVNKVR